MNKNFLKRVVELSKQSQEEGKFPAGALLVKDGKIVYEETSSPFPDQHLHGEIKVIDQAIADIRDQLGEYELYTSLAPCLMCLGKIYWSGIKKVYFILSREDTCKYLEGEHDFNDIVSKFNKPIEFIQDKTYYDEAKDIYDTWEETIL
ncbi:hypothetical protein GF360_02670 [candidate division WWE3 bacterium]|nr:hypothetical protein [candidate division WWE3 bacterium]